MKQPRRILSVILGAAPVIGSMLAMPGTASAAPGDLTASGSMTLGALPTLTVSASATGTVFRLWLERHSGWDGIVKLHHSNDLRR